MLSTLWEILVCFYEAMLILYLLYRKTGSQTKFTWKLVVTFLLLFGVMSALTLAELASIPKMALMLACFVFTALWAFGCAKKHQLFNAVFWPMCYLLIVAVADNVTFTIAETFGKIPLEKLMTFGTARIQFTLIYLLLVTVMVWAMIHFSEPNPKLPLIVSIVFFILIGVGLFAVESILAIVVVLQSSSSMVSQGKGLSDLCYIILLLLFALMITFESIGSILEKNDELKQEQQLALMEQQEYELMVKATESLRVWKHDYQGQLRLISSLIEQEKYTDLKQFTEELNMELPTSAFLLSSGNRILDSVVTLHMFDAKRYNIGFKYTLFVPEQVPLNDAAFASLIGNLLDNAVEACRKDVVEPEITFEIRPWKQMMYIHCSNTSNGQYLKEKCGSLISTKNENGHGIGLKRIKDISEQAGGTCQFIPGEKSFSVSIMIPLEETENEDSNS